MRRIAGVALVAVWTVSVPAFAEPPAEPPAAEPETPPPAAATAAEPPPVAAPAPAAAPERKPWKEWLDREPPPIPEPETKRVWYGWQNLLIDGIALSAVVLTGSQGDNDAGAVAVSLGLLAIGSPITHFAHLNIAGGLGSLAIRAASGGLFALGVEISTDNSFDSSGDEETEGVALGVLGLIGVATAIVLDAAYFGFEEKPVPGQNRAWLTPWVDPERHRVGVGYAATF